MNVLHLSTDDIRGGAAVAAYRLHRALAMRGLQSRMLVQRKNSSDQDVFGPSGLRGKIVGAVRWHTDSLPLIPYVNRRKGCYSPAWLPERLGKRIDEISPDIVHLHWVARGFLRLEHLSRFHRPMVWTLHDMWAFTGGCHYDEGCGRYVENCGSCPILASGDPDDLSHRVWRRKHDAWADVDLTVVAPSNWLATCARASSLLGSRRIEVIPNGIDTNLFRPLDNASVRAQLALPPDKKIILFGAVDATAEQRKGFMHLKQALQALRAMPGGSNYMVVVFGAEAPSDSRDIGVSCRYLGNIQQDKLVQVYNAADVFVAPSVQENLPNTVLEALACGVPCVAFDIGGMPDLIETGKNGCLVKPYDTAEMARAIQAVLEDEQWHRTLSFHAREKTEQEFALDIVGRRYAGLYEEIVRSARAN